MIEMSCTIQILCGKLLGMKLSNRLNSVADLFKKCYHYYYYYFGAWLCTERKVSCFESFFYSKIYPCLSKGIENTDKETSRHSKHISGLESVQHF